MRRQLLQRIVEGVRLAPGFGHGFWTGSSPARSHTFIVFSDRAAAEGFAEDVRDNLENQARAGVRSQVLDVAEIVAPA